MSRTLTVRRRPLQVAGPLALLVGVLLAPRVAAPLPRLLLAAQGDGFNRPERLFQDRPSDFGVAGQVFNTVLISPGNQSWVTDATQAGLQVILEFDYKWDFIDGFDITGPVQSVIEQIRANPGSVAGVHVADRLNSWAEPSGGHAAIPPAQMLQYLRLTGGAIHQQLPGLPVFVDVEDEELTCGQPGQAGCDVIQPGSTSIYRYENNAVLTQLWNSGYVDGFFLADNLATTCTSVTGSNCWNPTVQAAAWRTARCLWPPPFMLLARTSRLSFWQATYPGDDAMADRQTQGAMVVPIRNGANGADLWGWHIPWTDNNQPSVRTWLDKDESGNPLWQRMTASAAPFLGDAGDASPPTGSMSGPAAGDRLAAGQTAAILSDLRDPAGIGSATADLSIDDGQTFTRRVYCGAYGDTLPWIVPQVSADSCRIRLTAWDLAGNPGMVTTNGRFSIYGGTTGVGGGMGNDGFTLGVRPAPARDRATVVFTLPRRAAVRLDVVDVGGRRRRLLSAGPSEAGLHSIPWETADDRGRPLESGVYFVRLQTEGRLLRRSLIVVR